MRSEINYIIYSAKYNRTECLCVFLTVASYYVLYITLYVLLYNILLYGHNYPTRLETRTKEFNWIASRRV